MEKKFCPWSEKINRSDSVDKKFLFKDDNVKGYTIPISTTLICNGEKINVNLLLDKYLFYKTI